MQSLVENPSKVLAQAVHFVNTLFIEQGSNVVLKYVVFFSDIDPLFYNDLNIIGIH